MNPYGNNGFNRINQTQRQPDPRYQQQQQQYQRQINPQQPYTQTTYQQPYQQRQAYAQPGYQQPTQQYIDPRFQQPMMDPRFQQPMYQQPVMDPRFQQPMMDPRFQQPYNQPYRTTMVQQQTSFGRINNPIQQHQPYNQIAEKTISSAVEDVEINNNTQVQQTTVSQPVKNEVRCQDLSPADGHEFPPYYDKDTEKLEKVVDRNTCTYTWKIVKGGDNE